MGQDFTAINIFEWLLLLNIQVKAVSGLSLRL